MPELYFIGTGTSETRGELNEGGFILQTDRALLFIDPGPGASQCKLKLRQPDASVVTSNARGHDAELVEAKETIKESAKIAGIEIEKKEAGWIFRTPDGKVTYITGIVKLKNVKKYSAEVIVFYAHGQEEKILEKLKPRLAIITGYNKEMLKKGPIYIARGLQKQTGVQTIAAKDELRVDLSSYSAVSEQKGLGKFS